MSYNLEQAVSGYACYSPAGLVIGTTTGTFKIASAIDFTNNGVFKTKAITDNIPFSAGHTALAIGQNCLFAVWISATGAVTTTQGPIGTGTDPCPVPTQVANNVTLVGLIKVSLCTAVFTPGTTALGTGNTATYFDCARMPGTAV
jgi:hypothetical protein